MKEFFKKISSFLMALIVLFSTFSFTISEHYCGDELVNSSLLSKAKPCSMENQNTSSNSCKTIEKKKCCSDEQINIEGQDELNSPLQILSCDQQLFIASFVHSYISLFKESREQLVPFRDYSPPFIVQDIQVLDETYLI